MIFLKFFSLRHLDINLWNIHFLVILLRIKYYDCLIIIIFVPFLFLLFLRENQIVPSVIGRLLWYLQWLQLKWFLLWRGRGWSANPWSLNFCTFLYKLLYVLLLSDRGNYNTCFSNIFSFSDVWQDDIVGGSLPGQRVLFFLKNLIDLINLELTSKF